MVKEAVLKEPIGNFLFARFQDSEGYKCLCHEEPKGRGGRTPDIVFVHAPVGASELECIIEVLEIENTLKGAIRDRKHGLNQLKKYSGHMKYLAIPHTIHRMKPEAIQKKCISRNVGLLVVGRESVVQRIVVSTFDRNSKGIQAYPMVRKRWHALRKSSNTSRWIRQQTIYERDIV